MQATVRDAPGLTADLTLPTADLVVVAFGGFGLLAILLGGPVLAASLGGLVLAIVVAAALVIALVAIALRVGIEFERAWMRGYSGPLLGEDRASGRPGVLLPRSPVDARAGRPSELAGLGSTTPAP